MSWLSSVRCVRHSFPPFSQLKSNWPTCAPLDTRTLIGGEINHPSITNFCAIKVSHALNLSGHIIPPFFSGGVRMLRGGNGFNYIARVPHLVHYLTMVFGPADHCVGPLQRESSEMLYAPSDGLQAACDRRHAWKIGRLAEFKQLISSPPLQGIIILQSGRYGHADVWDGCSCRGQCTESFWYSDQGFFWKVA